MPKRKPAKRKPRSPRRRSSRATAARPQGRRRRLLRLFGAALLTGGVLLTAYAVYLDALIRVQFEGRRWAVPARVYARPLELYPGLQLTAAQLGGELRRLGYRELPEPAGPGSYAAAAERVTLYTRAFRFPDGEEPERELRVDFSDGRVADVRRAVDGAPVDLARLEPVVLGGIYPAHREDRILIRLDEVPPLLVRALIAVEDRGFRDHFGIDPLAIGRAALANLRAGATVQGGSTLTQQLVKNYFLTNERSLWRKGTEAIMAMLLELHYSKDEILQAYLNEVYLGQDGRRGIHGVGLASRYYFGRSVSRLTLAQSATLVALVRGPSYYDPWRHAERLRARRDRVLALMAGQGLIPEARARGASETPLGVVEQPRGSVTRYPAFMDLVRRQLRRDYRDEDLTSEGLRIFTTFDPVVEEAAESGLRAGVTVLERERHISELEGAVVVTRPDTGEVLAMVGGRDPRYPGFNRALDARRQVGSLLKPAVYLTALAESRAYTPITLIDDAPVSLRSGGQDWKPANYDGASHGQVPMYRALAHSYNQATVRLGMNLGMQRVADTLRGLGIESDIPLYPSTLLGAVALSPYEITQMYQTLAAGGFRTPLRAIRQVVTADGEPLRRYPLEVEQAVDPAAVAALDSALEEVVRDGTARSLRHWLPESVRIAGKTGTTNDLRDSWFAGFSGQHLTVVWLGRDDNRSVGLTGASGALRVFGETMARLHTEGRQPMLPDGAEEVGIDPQTLLVADASCADVVPLTFVRGTAPRDYAPCAGGKVRRAVHDTVDWFRKLWD